jgi:hypothetical protein
MAANKAFRRETGQAGSQGCPLASMTRVSKQLMPCLAENCLPPVVVRRPPDTFCRSLNMRISRSGSLRASPPTCGLSRRLHG